MAGQNPGSPTDFQYFYEDEVYKINNRGQVVFGLVLENYEANSSDQESDIETPIQKGEIRVVWHPSGTERVISEKSVGLADRSLMPGDVVRRLIAGKDTQRGYCRDIVMTAALQIVGTKHVIPSVASERLQPVEEFTPDLAVCLDSWVGTSKAVHSKIRLVSADGSRLEYPDLDSCPLEDYSMRRRRTTPYASSEFYPGQVVYGPLGSLDSANWLHITKEMKAARKHKMHDHKFTVEAVVTESVSVHWQCRALSTLATDSNAPQQPKFLVEGDDLKNLKLLNVFEPCTLQVGDRNFLTIGPEDTFISKKQWRKHQSKYYRNLRKQSRPVKKPSKTDANSTEHIPSRPKKRASSHRKLKSTDNEMEVDGGDEKLESLDEALKADLNCPSIKIEPSADVTMPVGSSQEDTATEEKNDSGISGLSKSHIRSPEPSKEDNLLNGDSKAGDSCLNDDDSDNWENTSSDGSDTDSGATWSSRCSSAASQRGKRSPQLAVRLLRGKRLKRTARRAPPAPPPRLGDRVVVVTLHTTSHANVVWQDGTIEMGIPSTQLYPIHHLDGQECFPGDFVVSGAANVEENQQLKHREYGVVQRVDHHGRTAIVHWYRTYTSADEPVPQMLYESEMSVYDLKDHPDFQYRPGTVVIRVANFTGEDANCTAGQVIDNFPSGRVKVWWVDGHTSMCWPQDLYKVGEYDSEEGELWGSEASGSEDSWETQSSARDEPRTPDTAPQPPLPAPPTPYPVHAPHAPHTPQLHIHGRRKISLPVLGNSPSEETTPEVGNSGTAVVLSSSGVPRLLEPRVAAHIERGRVAMRRLEEMFAKHPTLQSQEIMRKLLNLYKDCRFLDRLMGTTFFHEDHFLGLLERVRERGASTPRAGERRVHEQLARLFTPSETSETAETAETNETGEQDAALDAMIVDDDKTKDQRQTIITANVTVEAMDVESSSSKKPLHLNIEPIQSGSSAVVSENTSADNMSGEAGAGAGAESEAEGGARNVCYKLCSLIHAQLVKAHAEVSRRRPQELAEFLNSLMKNSNASEEKLPYHFSVQYGALVVSMADQEEKGQAKAAPADAKDNTTAAGASPDAKNVVGAEAAPLATGEAEAEVACGVAEAEVDAEGGEGFCVLESAPAAHRFRLSMLQPSEPRSFYSAVKREIKLLKSDLPSGVWVRGFEDRIDLLSVMIAGPSRTPYEGGLFVFDVQLGGEYPRAPPLCHYHSYCSDRLNPNLYEDGKVCVSLLGTWSGRGVEVWGKDSSLLQVIVSLQGLILNAEPYFNEAGYEKQKGTQQGKENSRMYNEMVLLKLVQSMTRMVVSPPEPFREEVLRHMRGAASALCQRLESLVMLSSGASTDLPPPEYPLLPASRGFCLTLRSSLDAFRAALRRNDIDVPPSVL
ncbi:PREDICTED: E2/E3 hybrid ubiquitin-protein ligase UBE2O isoform X2 [Papilio xuthus]|uniref:E2/E3 hybrid ubiquitin-protein ligase UBE2O isoform X2 n=1 Tax=Papilio xuthus TaxID=66420 RepID=A0AAJ6ZC70_PAPXU|nr:PREDICTED: E2/E3 hybrid ubiquitin-protein ligase UBE2O isoform X2 [Papilio xuthus]